MQPDSTIFLLIGNCQFVGEFVLMEQSAMHNAPQLSDRKKWIDNLRWITILTVVVFHVFYYYNNIGQDAMFSRLPANPAAEGGKTAVTFAGIFQYFVYQWFMLLLFVISGMCARYTLQTKTLHQFMKSRVRKILVPSTLGIFTIQWIGGWIITRKFLAGEEAAQIPGFVKYLISVASGTGALWFCHVLFVACLVLALIKHIDKKCRLEALGEKAGIFAAAGLVVIMIGAAQILNIKMIPTYRFGYDTMAFLFGYYVFSSEKLLEQLKKYGWICLIIGAGFWVWHFVTFYGQMYSDAAVQNSWISIVHAWFTVLGILGVAQKLEFENTFSKYMCKTNWGIYINHILIMIVLNTLLEPIAANLPVAGIYAIELVVTLTVSIGLWEVLKRIPVIKYVLYGL